MEDELREGAEPAAPADGPKSERPGGDEFGDPSFSEPLDLLAERALRSSFEPDPGDRWETGRPSAPPPRFAPWPAPPAKFGAEAPPPPDAAGPVAAETDPPWLADSPPPGADSPPPGAGAPDGDEADGIGADTAEQAPVQPDGRPAGPRRISVLAALAPTDRPETRTAPGRTPAGALGFDAEPATGELPVVFPPVGRDDTIPLPVGKSGRPRRPGRTGRRRLARWIAPAAAVLALAGAYVGASYYYAERVPKAATVAGVEIGGLTSQEAVERLRRELDVKAGEAVSVTIGDAEASFDPVVAGLGYSPEETVAAVTGLNFNPAWLWRQVEGLGALRPYLVVDHAALESHVADLAAQTRREPVNGTVTVAGGEVATTEPVAGLELDTAAAVRQIEADYLVKAGPWQLPVTRLAPPIDQADIDQAVAAIANPLLSGPVAVTVADAGVELPADELATAALIGPDLGNAETLALTWDKELLSGLVSKRLPSGVETQAEDARFAFVDGQPVIEDGRPGSRLDPDQLAQAVTAAALAAGDERRAAAELVEVDPAAGRAELEKMGVTQIVARFETQATNSADRTKNLRKAAEIVTGTLVRPGETFSLDQALGHRSLETGWFNAGVVVAGVSQDGIGGGLSQFSTTLYNAAHLAGMVDVAHQPHANYFSRYPMGREATLWEGQIDNQFKNDTPYGVVLRAGVSDSLKVWVELWSTKYWTVEAAIGQPYSYVAPRTIESTKSDCQPQSAGSSGFQVDYWRLKTDPDGNAQERETWHWRYDPMNAIVCKPPASSGG